MKAEWLHGFGPGLGRQIPLFLQVYGFARLAPKKALSRLPRRLSRPILKLRMSCGVKFRVPGSTTLRASRLQASGFASKTVLQRSMGASMPETVTLNP